LLLTCLAVALASMAQAAGQSASTAAAKVLGTIQSLDGNNFIVKSDEGAEVHVAAQDATRFLQVNPGQTDLKQAVPIHLQDLQTADRVLVRGSTSPDKKMTAATVIVMKKIDVEAKQQRERQDWQKRGIGGLVSAVDPASGDIMITVTALGAKTDVVVLTTKETVIRRYAPNSVRFDDARQSTLAEIKPGDQLRARGTRSDDGKHFTAEEVVSGTFRNIAGTITAIDAPTSTITVADGISKNTVQVKVTSASQLRKLPAPMAQRIALRLKGGSSQDGAPSAGGTGAAPTNAMAASASRGAAQEGMPGRGAGADLQQMLNRLPALKLTDFQKGDALMIVSTEGAAEEPVTAITVLGGVEPILAATPKGSKDMVLSPWSLSAPEGGG